MAYIDKAYFLTKISSEDLTRLSGGTDSNITEAIDEAQEMIDGALRSITVDVPLDTPPKQVKLVTYWIATYILHDRPQFDDIPERIKDNYKNAAQWIKDVVAGRITLDIEVEEDSEAAKFVTNPSTSGKMNQSMF